MGENMNQLEGGRFYIEGQPMEWSGSLPELKPEGEPHEEAEPTVPTVPASMELTLTPEQQEAIKKAADLMAKVWETVKAALDYLGEAARTIWEQVCELYAHAALAASKGIDNLMDAMLYAANDNPKWWHYYKHAKKKRTRKKYRRLLMQQLLTKLGALNANMIALNAQKAET